jgi:predicted RNase H-like nuclease (RuvC/YqgF family)
MLTNQGATISEQEGRIRQQAAELQNLASEIDSLSNKLQEAITAKNEAENIINRQGEKINGLLSRGVELERRVSEQSEKVHMLERERESLVEKLPTQEDAEALAAMSALLMRKVTGSPAKAGPQMRLADAA